MNQSLSRQTTAMRRGPLFALAATGLVSLAGLAYSGGAHAQSSGEPRWYAGGGVGSASSNTNKGDYTDQQAGASTSFGDDKGTAWKLYSGLQFNRNWGVELGYSRLGRYENDYSLASTGSSGQGNNKLSAWSLAGVGTLPLNDAFSLNAKAGLALVRNEYSFSGTGPSYVAGDSGTDRSTNLFLGVGAKYNINKNFALRVDYENYGKAGKDTNNLTTLGATGTARPTLLTAGVQYTF